MDQDHSLHNEEDDNWDTDFCNDYMLSYVDNDSDNEHYYDGEERNEDVDYQENLFGSGEDNIDLASTNLFEEDNGDELHIVEYQNINEAFNPEKQVSKTREVQHETFETPGGTKYWVPIVEDSVKIAVGYEFPTIEVADAAYRKYANEAGFDVRQSNKKINKYGDVQTRYLLCSKQGYAKKKSTSP